MKSEDPPLSKFNALSNIPVWLNSTPRATGASSSPCGAGEFPIDFCAALGEGGSVETSATAAALSNIGLHSAW
jgi:hypothetical protein